MAELAGKPILTILAAHWQALLSDVERRLPNEACGLVAGSDGISTGVFPVSNVLSSPVRFRMSPGEQIRTMWQIEAMGWDLAAVYHSHPNGPPVPSGTDISEAGYPEAVQLIISPGPGGFQARGYLIAAGGYQQVSIQIENRPAR